MSKNATPRTYDGLYLYLARIRKYPMLTPESEIQLVQAMLTTHDERARQQLINSHLRFVAKLAKAHHKRYGLSLEELIGAGNVGLIEGVKRFEPAQGVRLATYVRWKINQEIKEYILHNWSLVKIGTNQEQKKIFFNLSRLKAQLGILDDGDLSQQDVTKIADELKVRPENVVTMNRRIRGDWSLNTPIIEDGETEWQDALQSEEPDPEKVYASRSETGKNKAALAAALNILNARERDIFVRRRLCDNPESYLHIARDYNVSHQRIEQVDKQAFKKVQRAVCAHLSGDTLKEPRPKRQTRANIEVTPKTLEAV